MEITSYWQLKVITLYLKTIDQSMLECDCNNVNDVASLVTAHCWRHRAGPRPVCSVQPWNERAVHICVRSEYSVYVTIVHSAQESPKF